MKENQDINLTDAASNSSYYRSQQVKYKRKQQFKTKNLNSLYLYIKNNSDIKDYNRNIKFGKSLFYTQLTFQYIGREVY